MPRLALPLVALLSACSPEFGLQGIEPRNHDPAEDTAAPVEDEPTAEGTPPAEEEEEEEETPPATEEEEEEETPVEEEPAPEDDCTETDDLVYVISRDDNGLYLFDPEALRFESLGRLSCSGAGGATPGSMAVGRDGMAWVRMSDDSLYQVDLETLACSRTSFRLPSGFDSFGMGFATEHADTWRDHLFVADARSLGLLDTTSLAIEPVGGMASQSELTGNADGELWAFLPLESPAALVQLDQDDGRELDRIRLTTFPPASDIDTFAFATWGGDFWLFVRTYGMGNTTDVYRVTTSGTMTRELVDVGFDVVGAGVSTCAPTE